VREKINVVLVLNTYYLPCFLTFIAVYTITCPTRPLEVSFNPRGLLFVEDKDKNTILSALVIFLKEKIPAMLLFSIVNQQISLNGNITHMNAMLCNFSIKFKKYYFYL